MTRPTPAGTDALSGMLRAAIDLDADVDAAMVSVDDRIAPTTPFHVLRSCASCATSPRASRRSSACGMDPLYCWSKAMRWPQPDAIVAADEPLCPRCMLGRLPAVYVVTTPACAREALDIVTSSIAPAPASPPISARRAPPDIGELGRARVCHSGRAHRPPCLCCTASGLRHCDVAAALGLGRQCADCIDPAA